MSLLSSVVRALLPVLSVFFFISTSWCPSCTKKTIVCTTIIVLQYVELCVWSMLPCCCYKQQQAAAVRFPQPVNRAAVVGSCCRRLLAPRTLLCISCCGHVFAVGICNVLYGQHQAATAAVRFPQPVEPGRSRSCCRRLPAPRTLLCIVSCCANVLHRRHLLRTKHGSKRS